MKMIEVAKEIAVALGCCHCLAVSIRDHLCTAITYAQKCVEE